MHESDISEIATLLKWQLMMEYRGLSVRRVQFAVGLWPLPPQGKLHA